MAYFPSYKVVITLAIILVLLVFPISSTSSSSQLCGDDFYKKSCPNLLSIVRNIVRSAIKKEARMGASLLRLHFHDCFVNGCDGSVLLDDTSSFKGEKGAGPNVNSVRGFDVVDKIKSAVERACPRVVSCADILAISARDSVVALGGPNWEVKLARRDARTTSLSAANNGAIPPPTSTLTALINRWKALNLSTTDLVALSGAHTIGEARCTTFRARIYDESSNVDGGFARLRQANCPEANGSGDNNTAPLDLKTSTMFDNNYYKNLYNKKGLLRSDQILFMGDQRTDPIVERYIQNPNDFSVDFVAAMIKMGDLSPLTGKNGEIRKNCRKAN